MAENTVDGAGRLQRLQLGKGWMDLSSDVKIPLKGWTKNLTLSASKPEFSEVNGTKTWKAKLTGDGAAFALEQSVREADQKLIFHFKVSAESECEIEGVMFWLDLPVQHFAGGNFFAGRGGGFLPLTLPPEIHLMKETVPKVAFLTADNRAKLTLEMSLPVPVLIQDGRKWGHNLEAVVEICSGTLKKGDFAELDIALSMLGKVEETPALLTLNPAIARYNVMGIGGNYCFNLESPVTRFTLDNLKPAFARTEMTLQDWAPKEPLGMGGGNPEKPDWREYVARDGENSHLRHEFEMMRELSRRKIPYCKSIWKLPAWMYTEAPADPNAFKNKIAPAKWPRVLEAIGTYLLYAKEKYGAEPDYFSFNEPDYGVNVYFTPEEHRDAIKLIGAHLRKLGLKTTMLLGDVSNPRDTQVYAEPAAADPEALKYIGAVSIHSWGGAKPEQYAAWSSLARKLNLPLLAAEAGPDAEAWHGDRFHSFEYGVEEITHYQELFLYATPQAVLYWEFTGDYSLLNEKAAPGKTTKALSLSERYCLQKHWCEFIPPGSDALQTSSDNAAILFTAFKHNDEYSLNLSNSKWSRSATVSGIPAHIKTLNVVRTARGELFKRLAPIPVVDGKVTLDLPTQSLTTLTTLETPELKHPE